MTDVLLGAAQHAASRPLRQGQPSRFQRRVSLDFGRSMLSMLSVVVVVVVVVLYLLLFGVVVFASGAAVLLFLVKKGSTYTHTVLDDVTRHMKPNHFFGFVFSCEQAQIVLARLPQTACDAPIRQTQMTYRTSVDRTRSTAVLLPPSIQFYTIEFLKHACLEDNERQTPLAVLRMSSTPSRSFFDVCLAFFCIAHQRTTGVLCSYFGAWTGVFRYFPGLAQSACGECEEACPLECWVAAGFETVVLCRETGCIEEGACGALARGTVSCLFSRPIVVSSM